MGKPANPEQQPVAASADGSPEPQFTVGRTEIGTPFVIVPLHGRDLVVLDEDGRVVIDDKLVVSSEGPGRPVSEISSYPDDLWQAVTYLRSLHPDRIPLWGKAPETTREAARAAVVFAPDFKPTRNETIFPRPS